MIELFSFSFVCFVSVGDTILYCFLELDIGFGYHNNTHS